ncbi:MAG: hypothetical protein JWQ03_1548 [Variovorax sp.]|nr:hypothetical protein [Variovorax sp.]
MEVSSLAVQRLSMARWQAAGASGGDVLGALAYGTMAGGPAPRGSDQVMHITARLLSDGGPQVDVWRSSGEVEAGRSGDVRWWRDANWLFGTVDLDEARHDMGFEEISRRAYKDIFATLTHGGRPHLLRVWNYVPRINGDGGGLERYRQFNAGRQQAFLEARRPVLEGAPAACALGTPSGPLSIRFLAGRAEPVPVENPRQVSAYRYPRDYGPSAPTFSRAALASLGDGRVALLISGTASIVGHASVHPGDVRAQTRETLRNLQAVIDSARTRCNAPFDIGALDCVVYVRDPADAPAVRETLVQHLGASSHSLRNAVVVQADICRSDLLVEIEAHAVAAGALLA